jgi:hypothetical protein
MDGLIHRAPGGHIREEHLLCVYRERALPAGLLCPRGLIKAQDKHTQNGSGERDRMTFGMMIHSLLQIND